MWIALAFPSHSHHLEASEELSLASAEHPAVFCRQTEIGFLRVSTTPAVLRQYGVPHHTNSDALKTLGDFQLQSNIAFHVEPPGTVALWHRLAGLNSASPKVWMDAYLAAFAILDQLTLVTIDNDFTAFVKDGLDLRLITKK